MSEEKINNDPYTKGVVADLMKMIAEQFYTRMNTGQLILYTFIMF